jgi:hypothetical protein
LALHAIEYGAADDVVVDAVVVDAVVVGVVVSAKYFK